MIPRRSLLTFEVAGARLTATVHEPLVSRARLGLLLLNAGPAPRAGNSDLSVYLADAAAKAGVYGIRVDLPGLGDSTGPVPDLMLEFWGEVLKGRNVDETCALLPLVRDRLGLRGLLLGGLCAGAVTAIHAAARSPQEVAGLFLLEPAMHVGDEDMTDPSLVTELPSQPTGLARRARRVRSLTAWLRYLTGESLAARLMRPLHPLMRAVLARRAGNTYPQGTHLPLAHDLSQVAAARTPILILSAEGSHESSFLPRVLAQFTKREREAIHVVKVTGTNHIFTAGEGRAAAVEALRGWLAAEYAATEADEAVQHCA